MVDGPRVYRASSLGYSLEQLVAGHLGYEPLPAPPWLQKKFDEGKEIEPKCIEKLRGMGWTIRDSQDEVNAVGDNQIEVELDVIPGVAKIVGHLDGQVSYGCGFPAILEVKSMAHKPWLEWHKHGWKAPGIIQKYKWQASALMLAKEMPHCMVAWDKETEELSWLTITEPFYTISDFALKLSAAEDYINKGIVPEGCTDYPCSFFYLHAPVEDPTPAPAELDGLLNAWKEANARKKAAEGEEKALRELVVEHMGEIAAKVRGSQGVTVSTTWVEEKEVSYVKAGHWETRITSPREKKGGNGVVASDG